MQTSNSKTNYPISSVVSTVVMDVDVLGAMNAMQDAVVLANCLYDLEDLSPESLTAAFEDYKSQRYKEAKKQVANSKLNARVSSGQVQFSVQRWNSCPGNCWCVSLTTFIS